MPPVPGAESGTYRPFTRNAGDEPLAGYRLLEPLGRGGFGEVWKCEAPGGLHKAIKFVQGAMDEDDGDHRLTQELDAFQQIKAIRHPFLLTLERVELVENELVMVMELADRQLADRYRECRNCNLPGIPRDELLAYFADAAEALDMISAKYGLQHLDVKPANLFLIAGHVKVGDYGLVARLDPDGPASGHRGLTPKYVAPEALRGEPSSKSDQYSLALVYQELLTGIFPYNGKTAQQMMLQHVSSKPDVSSLPAGDQSIVTRALAKSPDDRYPSCLAFVQALLTITAPPQLSDAGMDVRRARVQRSMAEMELPVADALEAEPLDSTGRPAAEITKNVTIPSLPKLTTPGRDGGQLPKLVSANQQPTPSTAKPPAATPSPVHQGNHPLSTFTETSSGGRLRGTVLNPIRSVVPIDALLGTPTDEPVYSPDDFVRCVLDHAVQGAYVTTAPGEVARLQNGHWVCQFPTSVPLAVAPIKLAVVRERWGVTVEQPEPSRIVLRLASGGGFWKSFSGKKSGIEVTIEMPSPPRSTGEAVVTGKTFGSPDADFARQAQEALPQILGDIRRELKNIEDRRKHPRVAMAERMSIYPIHSDGSIDSPIFATSRDISLSGVSMVSEAHPSTKYVYVTFDDIEATVGQAVLLRLVRKQTLTQKQCFVAGFFRTDL